jgi:hypothetical protein
MDPTPRRFVLNFGDLASPKHVAPESIVEFINQPRHRGMFTVWNQGYKPKEHREMLDRDAMLKWPSETEAKRAERDR